MSDSLFKKMPVGLEYTYREIAKIERDAAKSKKRAADAKALKAIADALKEHGDPEQYEACRTAIATLFEEAMEEIGVNLDDDEADA